MGKVIKEMKRLINFVLPVQACNFKCHYCYIGQENRFNGQMGNLQYSLDHMQKALTKERFGGVCHFNVCGLGETLLAPYAVELIKRLLENGHFVSVVTNGTISKAINSLRTFCADDRKRLFVKFSFHYLELKRTNLLHDFFANIQTVKEAGISYSVELTVNDETIPYIDEMKQLCKENIGAYCHVIESRNNNDGFSRLTALDESEHRRNWEAFQSPLFEFQQKHWMKKREEFCYAGDWVVSILAESGCMMPCFAGGEVIQNVFEDIEEPIHFTAIGCNCRWNHCYAAHILLSSGVIPDIEAPAYALFRDRCTDSGENWLMPDVAQFFSSKLRDENNEYSFEKKKWINALNKIINDKNYAVDIGGDVLHAIRAGMDSRGIRNVAVYGSIDTEEWMYEILQRAGIACKYGFVYVDGMGGGNIKDGKFMHQVKYPMKKLLYGSKLVLLNQKDRLPRVDAVIVCDTKEVSRCRKRLGDRAGVFIAWNELCLDAAGKIFTKGEDKQICVN